MKKEQDLGLQRVSITGAVDIARLTQSVSETGSTERGSADLIRVNGETFRLMMRAGLVF